MGFDLEIFPKARCAVAKKLKRSRLRCLIETFGCPATRLLTSSTMSSVRAVRVRHFGRSVQDPVDSNLLSSRRKVTALLHIEVSAFS